MDGWADGGRRRTLASLPLLESHSEPWMLHAACEYLRPPPRRARVPVRGCVGPAVCLSVCLSVRGALSERRHGPFRYDQRGQGVGSKDEAAHVGAGQEQQRTLPTMAVAGSGRAHPEPEARGGRTPGDGVETRGTHTDWSLKSTVTLPIGAYNCVPLSVTNHRSSG